MSTVRLENVDQVMSFMRDVFPHKHPGVYLAGGAVRTLLTNEPVVDYDLFFDSKDTADKFEKDFLQLFGVEVVYRCPAGELVTIKYKKYKIQLIRKTWHPDIFDLMSRFDFTCCKFGVDLGTGKMHYSTDDEYDLRNKILRLNNLQYPVATLHRAQKYIAKGYKPSDWQFFWEDLLRRSRDIEMTEENLALYID